MGTLLSKDTRVEEVTVATQVATTKVKARDTRCPLLRLRECNAFGDVTKADTQPL